ncbi:MAG TPA: PilW family protein [Thermoanaerobaculia bacterium]|nr:PilW family protein [Thermoanaerobaculia bacterium]
MRPAPNPAPSREAGFTVVELLVSLVVVVEVLLGVLMLFDFSNRLTRAQINVSDMQQALRVSHQEIAEEIRMAGAGGLPPMPVAPGGALWWINGAADDQLIGPDGTPEVLGGTDILIVRGVFSTPLYHVDPKAPGTFTLNNVSPPAATAGTILIRDKTATLVPQNLTAIIDAVTERRPEALLLISPLNSAIYSVVELDPQNSVVNDPANITIAFRITAGTYTDRYLQFRPGNAYNPDLTKVAFVGLLEEHRFYIREEYAIPNDQTSELTPRLSRARTYPNTEVPYQENDDNWGIDIADNIMDMQIALGFDSLNGGGSILQDTNDVGLDDRIFEAADGQTDDWLFNFAGELPTDPDWVNARLHYLRINLLGRTERRDPKYEAPLLARIEDRTFAANHPLNVPQRDGGNQRMYRRRVLRTLIDLRNM